MVVSSRGAGTGGRAPSADCQVAGARGVADAVNFSAVSVVFSASAGDTSGDDGAVRLHVGLTGLDDAILAVEVGDTSCCVLDSCLSVVLGACFSAMFGVRFLAERVPRLSAVLGSCLSAVFLMGESIGGTEAPAWLVFSV
eukprot:1809087-Pleurochrysis_carterae.AAC.3